MMCFGKRRRKALALMLALTLLAESFVVQAAQLGTFDNTEASALQDESDVQTQAAGGDTTYYVSSVNGDDNNPGTSEEAPFRTLSKIQALTLQPGDKVLLEKGSVFNDEFLHLKEEGGSAEKPVIISTYGTGARPVISTNGKGIWYQDYGKNLGNSRHKRQGNVSTSLLLEDVEYIEISGLEITNTGGNNSADGTSLIAYNDVNVMNRTGVAGLARNRGTLDHIVLDDLYIHDVIGNVYDKHMLNGGIYFIAAVPAEESVTGVARYDDLVIQNCYIKNVNRWGLAASYTYQWDKFQRADDLQNNETCKRYMSTNVVMRNNYFEDVGGDALTTMYCYEPLVEHNVSLRAAKQINTTDYSATDFGRVAAGIWPWMCKNGVFQYNECYDMENVAKGNGDGQAWDADSGLGTLYQYNYSSGNTGGAVMFCLQQAKGNTFRYNISQNDLSGVLNLPSNPDAHIYNNTFYVADGVPFIRANMNNGKARVENNIIYYAGLEPKTENWRTGNVTYDNNLYVNYQNTPDDSNKIVLAAGEQVFKNPGQSPSAPAENRQVYDRSVFAGYQLSDNSRAANAGKTITDANGYALDKDFFGNAVAVNPSIGAAEVWSPIRSTVFMTDGSDIYVPSTAQNSCTPEELFHGVEVADGTSLSVWKGTQAVTSGALEEGMILRATGGEGNVKEYTIHIKNDYEWVKDHVPGVQGNLWFGQYQKNGSGYTNFTSYNSQYPQWDFGVSKLYDGVGVNGKLENLDRDRETAQGLLIGFAAGTKVYMTFRAPMSGSVLLGKKANEPYLRQSNASGSATLSLYLNDELIQSCTLSTLNLQGDFPEKTITVQKGDMIRWCAENTGNAKAPSMYITPSVTYQNTAVTDADSPSKVQ
ncbi:MAG: hypothetical protein ACLT3H_11570 [Roseburia sp.]